MFNNFFFSENRDFYEIMWEKFGRDGEATYGIIKRPMRIACWITNITDTHTEYVILLAFAR